MPRIEPGAEASHESERARPGSEVLAVLSHFTGAVARAFLVVVLVATPSLLLPEFNPDGNQAVALVALFAGALTLSEYAARYPSLIEFRDAPPFNRVRFISLFLTVFVLSIMARNIAEPGGLTIFVEAVGLMLGHVMDFPYSPVRLVLLSLPETTPEAYVSEIRSAAGVAHAIALVTLAFYFLLLRIFHWPSATGAFNVWVNLPTFDPTAGGDVVARLNRDARVNLALGFLLPFMAPAVAKATVALYGPVVLSSPQTLVWMVAAWAFLPLSLLMRGIAMGRIASMIYQVRRRNVPGMRTAIYPA